MDAPEEAIDDMGSGEHALAHPTNNTLLHQSIVNKGKRTKRLRPFSLPAGNSSGGEEELVSCDNNNNAETTEEEEDTANCLILLAQGHFSCPPPPLPLPPQAVVAAAAEGRDFLVVGQQGQKYSSRRYLETAATAGAGKVGYYVYQCKTCDKTFPSFQALGGHRASHKKPKSAAAGEDQKRLYHHSLTMSSSDEEGQFMIRNNINTTSSLSLQLGNTNNRGLYNGSMINKANKVHECSICGAEFTSGQALGGHMRRHRGPGAAVTTAATTAVLSLTPAEYSDHNQDQPINKKPKNIVSLDLDLNLPAPEDHELGRESKFIFGSKQQPEQQPPPPLVLSAPALVDCHY